MSFISYTVSNFPKVRSFKTFNFNAISSYIYEDIKDTLNSENTR